MRILILGPAAEVGGRVRIQVADRTLSLLELLQACDGPHDLFTCPHLPQASRYLSGLPFDLIVAGGQLGAQVLKWADEHASTLLRIPRCFAYDAEALVQTVTLKVQTAPLNAETIRRLVMRARVATGKTVDGLALATFASLREQAQAVMNVAKFELDALNDQKRQVGEAALLELGLDPAAGDYQIDEQTGDVVELKVN